MSNRALYAQRTIVKRTRRNQVVRIVKEHYLRDDLANPIVTKSFHGGQVSNDQHNDVEEEYCVFDASCFPHQVDVLERGASEGAITGVILLSTVLETVARVRGESARRRYWAVRVTRAEGSLCFRTTTTKRRPCARSPR